MAKTYSPLTKAFSTYFKQAIKKNDVFNIAADRDGYVYFVNGAIAGRIHKSYYPEILQPLTLREMPADGSTICVSGIRSSMEAESIFSVVKKNIEAATELAQNTGFKIKIPNLSGYANIIRIKSQVYTAAAINEKFFDMIDFEYNWTLHGYSNKLPVVASLPDQMDIIICPLNLGKEKSEMVDAIAGLGVFNP